MPKRLTTRRVVLETPVMVEKVKAMVVDGLTHAEIARQVSTAKHPITRQAVSAFIKRHKLEVAETQAKVIKAVEEYLIASKVERIAEYDADWQKLRAVQEARAADQTYAKHPGWSTGLLVHQLKSIGGGDNAMVVDEFKVDTGLIAQKLQLTKAAADELGQIPRPDVHNTVNVGILVRQLAGYNPEDVG